MKIKATKARTQKSKTSTTPNVKVQSAQDVARPAFSAKPLPEAPQVPKQSIDSILTNLRLLISKTYFWNEGDGNEQKYWPIFRERFPNLEYFWRYFIVPTSRRIELTGSDSSRIERRDQVDDKLWGIAFLHYSIFLHLTYAHEHMSGPLASSFGDFYAHLVSTSDLVQEFLLRTYVIILECRSATSRVLERLTKDEFLKFAAKWYDTEYGKVFEHYVEKGKWSPITIPTRNSVVAEYLENSSIWKEYRRFDQSVREYRNILVHREAVGEVILNSGISLAPRREKIRSYVELKAVFQAANNPERFRTDFISKQEQMLKDLFEMQVQLNSLWEKPIADMNSLLYEEQNMNLFAKYGIS